MKLIYVAHPYGGDLEKRKACARIIDSMQERFPKLVFVAGVTSINCDYNITPYHVGLALCLELLSRCEGIIMTNGFEDSKGCMAEMAVAKWLGIKVYGSIEHFNKVVNNDES